MNPRAARSTAAEIKAIKSAGRRRLVTVPAPLIAFGLVNLGGVPASVLLGRFHLAVYGVPALALAVCFSGRALAGRARTEGVQLSIRPFAVTAALLCLGGVSMSRLGDVAGIDVLAAVGPFLAQATGLWLLGRWAGSDALIAASVLMVCGSALIGSHASGDLAVALQFGLYGTLLLATAHHVTTHGTTT